MSSNNAALAAESLIDDGNKVIELFPDGHKDFNEMLLQESFAVNKMVLFSVFDEKKQKNHLNSK